MKFLLFSLIALVPAVTSAATPASIQDYADKLASLQDYAGKVRYAVLLPQSEDPVVYDIDMKSTAVPADSLAPCRYLIEWKVGGDGSQEGFSAYFDGSHYRYRDNRLQEYHMDWDSIPFIVGHGGVQCNAQFTDVLPQFLGRELNRLLADSNFVYKFVTDVLYDGEHVAALNGQLMYHGYLSKEATYIFDPVTMMPISITLENNPGAISEQSVLITYTDNGNDKFPVATEEDMIELYPEIFEKYRESNFRIENLPGTQLPTFTAPTPGGERYAYHHGDKFESPVVIALIDDDGGNTASTIEAVRKAAATSPVPFDIIWAFVSSDVENAREMTGRTAAGETLLTSARALARDCGVTACPTLLYVGRDGKVNDVTLGYNKNLTGVVIQTITLHEAVK